VSKLYCRKQGLTLFPHFPNYVEVETIDLLIKDVHLEGQPTRVDVAIDEGHIVCIDQNLDVSAEQVIEGQGKFLSPGFVDAHTHLDKTYWSSDTQAHELHEAIAQYTAYCHQVTAEQFKESILERSAKVLDQALRAGTLIISSHVNLEHAQGLAGVEAMVEQKTRYQNRVDIHVTAMPNFFGSQEQIDRQFAWLEEACQKNYLQGIGGAPYHFENAAVLTRKLFDLASRYGLKIDLHVDERDDPNIDNLELIVDLTKEYGMGGRVICSHITALSAVDDSRAYKVMEGLHRENIHVITLPSCNLYLMGRKDKEPIRRGITRIKELSEQGVNLSYASDNIRDPFRPIGNANMLEEGLLTAQVSRMLSDQELHEVYRMGTFHPAQALGIKDYGVEIGSKADVILLEASHDVEALVNQAAVTHVVKNGKLLLTKECSTQFMDPC